MGQGVVESVAALMQQVDKMNEKLLQDEPLKFFLWKLNYAVMRTGKPVPRAVLLKLTWVTKTRLQKLVKAGYLKEHRVQIEMSKKRVDPMTRALVGAPKTEHVGYTLGDNITFYGDKLVEVVQADAQQKGLESTSEGDSIAAQDTEGTQDAASGSHAKDIQGVRELSDKT